MNASPAYVTCPKCNGAKKIVGFSHIANGDCFLCSGNGTVLAMNERSTPATKAAKPSRTVTLPSFGAVQIERDAVGLVAYFPSEDADAGTGCGGMARFTVNAGQIEGFEATDGIRRALRPVALRELQAAVRA